MALKKFIAGKPNQVQVDGKDLAERISLSANGNFTMSGRGHGRKTPHGRYNSDVTRGFGGPKTKKQDMLYFVRDRVKTYRSHANMETPSGYETYEWANLMVHEFQYFDCSLIYQYAFDNLTNVFPDDDVPPSMDVILPADKCGFYFQDMADLLENDENLIDEVKESMFLCIPDQQTGDLDIDRRIFRLYWLGPQDPRLVKTHMPVPEEFARVDSVSGTIEMLSNEEYGRDGDVSFLFGMFAKIMCVILQTINQPRFVVQAKRDVSLVKRQSFKKATGKFTPDSWNMVTWNVDKAVKAKSYDEGSGGRQALHFRRGHWRKAEEGWERSRWSESRGRWEQYIHGYEAGHPAFGVKKSYHLPRKEPV
jgi:hypothetical protein